LLHTFRHEKALVISEGKVNARKIIFLSKNVKDFGFLKNNLNIFALIIIYSFKRKYVLASNKESFLGRTPSHLTAIFIGLQRAFITFCHFVIALES